MEREGPAKVKAHHDDAFRYINDALKFDEQGNKQKALQLYQKGLRTLVVGLSVYCSDSEPGWEKTKQLQKKMTSTKEQVKERIQTLSASLNPNPSAPSEDIADGQSQNGHLATDEELEACYLTDQERTSWEDVKELLVLDHSMKQFVCLLVLRS